MYFSFLLYINVCLKCNALCFSTSLVDFSVRAAKCLPPSRQTVRACTPIAYNKKNKSFICS